MAQIIKFVDEQSQVMQVLNAIQEIVNVTVGEFNVKKLAQQVVETIAKIVNAEASSMFLLDEDTQILTMIAGTGYWSSLVDKAIYQVGEGVTGTVGTGKIISTKRAEEHNRHPMWTGKYDNLQWGNSGKKCYSFLGAPLKFKERIVGVLKVENKKEQDKYVDFTLQDQRIVEILASHIAAVIENTKLYGKQQTTTIIKTLSEVTERIQTLNEINIIDARFDEVVQRIVEGALKLLNAKFCHLRLIEGDILKIKSMVGAGVEWLRTETKIGTGISGKVAESGEPVIIENVADWQNVKWKGEKYAKWEQANKYNLKSLCIAPLQIKDEHGQEKILGTLNTYLDRPRFSEVEIEMLKIFVTEAAIAISIGQQIKERMEMQKKLAESERMAAIGRLTSGVAHGFKNPLNAITLTLGRLKGAELKPYERYINRIYDQVDSMVKIINIFSTLSKPQTKAGVEISKIIEDVLQKLKKPENIEVNKIFDSIPRINCDSNQMEQVFENIILNAYEAMSDGGKLNVGALMEDKKLKIIFEDTGEGFHLNSESKYLTHSLLLRIKVWGLGCI